MTWNELVEAVIARAGERCEYCRMHQALQGPTFHVEHITPRSRGGLSDLDNLCFACATCNLRKSDRVEILDTDTGTAVPLFNPRTQKWGRAFSLGRISDRRNHTERARSPCWLWI